MTLGFLNLLEFRAWCRVMSGFWSTILEYFFVGPVSSKEPL